jgi:hypothetical protein
MTNTMQQELITYFTRLSEKEQQLFLGLLKNFINNRHQRLQPVTIEQYNNELDAAMQRIASKEFITLENLEKEIHSW